jgi:hypothetical protein
MQDSSAVNSWSHWTPKPVQKKGKVIEGTETEGSNSQVESEDSNFETPRALKRGTAPSAPFISTDNHSDTKDIVDQERVTASEPRKRHCCKRVPRKRVGQPATAKRD